MALCCCCAHAPVGAPAPSGAPLRYSQPAALGAQAAGAASRARRAPGSRPVADAAAVAAAPSPASGDPEPRHSSPQARGTRWSHCSGASSTASKCRPPPTPSPAGPPTMAAAGPLPARRWRSSPTCAFLNPAPSPQDRATSSGPRSGPRTGPAAGFRALTAAAAAQTGSAQRAAAPTLPRCSCTPPCSLYQAPAPRAIWQQPFHRLPPRPSRNAT